MGNKVYEGSDYKITIDEDKCNGCGDCEEACPSEVYGPPADGKATVPAIDECTGCMSCEAGCDQEAITVEEKE